jgi:eukaryotic-like serine/threonine-protein kinase
MARADDEAFRELVESVADGRPIDWSRQRFSDPVLQARADRLRSLESIGVLHRGGDQEAPPSPETWGTLRVLERLARGAGGEVFRAFDPSLEREVALKLLPRVDSTDPETGQRVLDEARRLARVRHPNVLFVHGAAEHDGRAGMWTDLLRGKDLETLLAEQGPFGEREAAMIGIDLCRALAAVHAAGLLHRDVKAANVIREEGGRIVLADFGIVAERPVAGGPVGEAPAAGSPLYMAPEALRGEPSSPASDLYSLGVLLFRLTTGRYPVEADSLGALMDRHRDGTLLRLLDARPGLTPRFARAVESALTPDPKGRYATAGEMAAALERAGADPPGTRGGALPLRGHRSRWIVLAAGVPLLFLMGFLFRARGTGAFAVDATLYRKGPAGDDPLLPGSVVHPGDRLYLEVQGNRDLHLYVLDEDERGHAFVLYPLPGASPTNPLPPGAKHRIPESANGNGLTWEVDTAGGQETLLLVASIDPLPDLEAEIHALPSPTAEGSPSLPGETAPSGKRLRGIGRLREEPAPPSGDAAGRLAALARDLGTDRDRAGRIWVREIRLENPGP